MNLDMESVIISILPSLLYVVAWIVVVVFSARMARSGGKPERFLLIGACLMLFGSLISLVSAGVNPFIVPNLRKTGTNIVTIALFLGVINTLRACLSAAGIVLMVLAFWWKFKAKQEPATPEQGNR